MQRTSAFAQAGNRHIEFLTLDPETDPKQKKKELVSQGWLDRRVKVRNLWADLRSLPDRSLQELAGTVAERIPLSGADLLPRSTTGISERHNADGKVVQTDYYRADGSLLLSDKFDFNRADVPGHRLLTAFSSLGLPLGQWTNLSEFYFAWFDFLTRGKPAIVITDSPGIGGRMRNYDRSNIVKCQVLHNFHHAEPTSGNDGPIASKWKNIVVNSDNYDVLAILTDDQREDMAETQLDPGNLVTVSNMFRGELISDIRPRARNLGIQVARLAPEKRVDHSLRAVAKVEGAHLDIYGFAYTQEFEDGLTALADELGVSDRAIMRGYDRNAKEYFKLASFSLLPSLYEGQGLVILESMASGCIPIAYDIKYGPSSMIEHGVDGFLVKDGDVDSLASTIEHVMNMPERDLESMRRSAVNKAGQYIPQEIVARWGEVLHGALARKTEGNAEAIQSAELQEVSVNDSTMSLGIKVTVLNEVPEFVGIAWKSRSYDLYGRVPATAHLIGTEVEVGAEIAASRMNHGTDNVLDVFVDVRVGGSTRRLRLESPSVEIPFPCNGIEPYVTENGNFSIRVHAQTE